MSSKPCLEKRPRSIFQTPSAGHCLDTHGPRSSCNNTLLRRVLRRFSKSRCFLEGFLEAPVRVFSKDKVLRRVLRIEGSVL